MGSPCRSLLAALAVGLLPVVAGCSASSTVEATTPLERLPDLEQRSPYGLTGQTAGTAERPRFRLGFASAVDNVGDGPLVVVGHRRPGGAAEMDADQLVRRADGSTRRVSRIGRLRYTISPDHAHWHFLRFVRYSLRTVPGGELVRPDRKTGFCLGDRYNSDLLTDLPAEPAQPVWTEECGKGEPLRTSIRQGISVGYGDDYDPLLEGQYVDITGLAPGRYELVHHVNADRRIRERDYGNNAASVIVDIAWPRGQRQQPRIDLVKRCGAGRRCSG